MERSLISSWIRQARYRAKRQNIHSDLKIEDVEATIAHYNNCCVYCEAEIETLDHPFPLTDTSPNIASNVVPCCKKCKSLKKSNDLVWMFTEKHLEQELYLTILQNMFNCRDGDKIKEHVRCVTGIGEKSEEE